MLSIEMGINGKSQACPDRCRAEGGIKVAGLYALMPFVGTSGARNMQSSLPPRHRYQNRQSMQALASIVLCTGNVFSSFIFSVFSMIESMTST
jgi:hypothetical protein